MIAFVVLHYKNLDDTIACVESLKKIKGNKKIIVVDNHSLNEETQKVLESKVNDVIVLDENIGFAKANNIGIQFAKEKYNPKFVMVLNSDTEIQQIDFVDRVKKNAQKYKFDLLGGKIITKGDSCNPFPALDSKEKVMKEIKRAHKLITIYEHPFLFFLLNIYMKIKHIFKKPKKMENGKRLCKNVPLHGCAILFSKQYLDKYEDAFINDTFLFHEEDFLYERIKKDHLLTIYDPKIEVIHKEGSSLNKTFKNERKKKLFRETERLKSLKLLLEYIQEGKE